MSTTQYLKPANTTQESSAAPQSLVLAPADSSPGMGMVGTHLVSPNSSPQAHSSSVVDPVVPVGTTVDHLEPSSLSPSPLADPQAGHEASQAPASRFVAPLDSACPPVHPSSVVDPVAPVGTTVDRLEPSSLSPSPLVMPFDSGCTSTFRGVPQAYFDSLDRPEEGRMPSTIAAPTPVRA